MKNLTKRLLAGFLSVWMLVCSGFASMNALAADDVYNSANTLISMTGVAQFEGFPPDDVIKVTMPKVLKSGAFDFIMDPYNLIKKSNASAYKTADGKTPEFGEGKFFFKNTSDNGTISYSRNSDLIRIVNESRVAVNVALRVEVDKTSNAFSFSDNRDFVDASDAPLTTPCMYMALVLGALETPVLPNSDSGKNVAEATAWIPGNADAYYLGWSEGSGYSYMLRDTFNTDNFQNIAFHLTGAINEVDWSAASKNPINLKAIWNVNVDAATKGPDTDPNKDEDVNPTVQVLFGAQNVGDVARLHFDRGNGALAMDTVKGLMFKNASGVFKNYSVGSAIVDLREEEELILVTASAILLAGSEWQIVFAKGAESYSVPFDLMKVVVEPDINPTVEVVSMAKTVDKTTKLTVDYGSGDYKKETITGIRYKNSGNVSQTMSVDSGNIVVDGANVTVQVVEELYKGSDWALVFSDGSAEYAVSFTLCEPSNEQPQQELSSDFGVTVTTPATAAAATAELSVNLGSMTKITGLSYTTASGTESTLNADNANITISADQKTVTVKAINALFRGSGWRLNFADDDGTTTSAYFNLKEAGKLEQPYIYVTKHATAAKDTAELTIVPGNMTSITAMTYTTASATSSTVNMPNVNIVISDDITSAQVTAINAFFRGSRWAFVFSDGSSQFVCRFNLT